MDTIFALATARGKAGVAVVRISGPASLDVAASMVGNLPRFREAALRLILDQNGDPLDQGLVLVFPEGHSFTGEDVVEFHLHGGMAVTNAVLRELATRPGLRLAQPGEFTRRALDNDQLDLAQVEGLADLIDAETESQRRQAFRTMSGALGRLAERWRADLIRASALLEATIDFVDEDVPVDVYPEVIQLISQVKADLVNEVAGSYAAERIRDGFEVAIVGPPNIGKSTLLNALAGREAAITSEIAGTTRDVIEVRMDLHGLPVTFLDTAGLRKTNDAVEAMGVDRAISRARAADLRVFLMADGVISGELAPTDGDILVSGKADLLVDAGDAVSGLTGQGISALVERITETLEKRAASAASATRERHRVALETAILTLDHALDALRRNSDQTELVAEDIRSGTRALESLVGLVDVENLLQEIFSSFCIGK